MGGGSCGERDGEGEGEGEGEDKKCGLETLRAIYTCARNWAIWVSGLCLFYGGG